MICIAAGAASASGLVGVGEVKDYDVSAIGEGAKRTGFDYSSVSDKPTVGELHIARSGKWTFSGKLAMVMQIKMTAKGMEIDESAEPEILLFNKNHRITVTMENGAVALLRGKRVKAIDTATFKLWEGDDKAFDAMLRDGVLVLVSEIKQLAAIGTSPRNWESHKPNATALTQIVTPGESGRTYAYPVVGGIPLWPKPAFAGGRGKTVSFGQRLRVLATKGHWIRVRAESNGSTGWLHRGLVMYTERDVITMRNAHIKPTSLSCVYDVKGTNSFTQMGLGGPVTIKSGRLAPDQFYSVVFADGEGLDRCPEISPRVLGGPGGVLYSLPPIRRPKPWTIYFFSAPHNKFFTLAELVTQKDAASMPPLQSTETKQTTSRESHLPPNWPIASAKLASGTNPVRIKNPNDFSVTVALRSGGKGKDFRVNGATTETFYAPNGKYDIYFQYSTDPKSLYQGDSFTLQGNGVEIQIVKVVGGNYRIRKVK